MHLKLDHIGYAVKDMDASIALHERIFGLKVDSRETLADRGIEICFLSLSNTKIELLSGVNSGNPITRFIETRGEGLHHVCYEVPDLVSELKRLKALGVVLIDDIPRPGAHGTSIAFLHPKSFHGVLVELCELDHT